jgi:membrane peptidoglycan carboxypeptidase
VDGRARGSVTLLDRYGETFAWRGDQFGGMITADSVSPHLVNAVVATEDRRFWWHPGVDPQGVASAIRINLAEGRGPLSGNGGSTITQQTAKLLCLGHPFDPGEWKDEAAYEADCRRTTLRRKVEEAVYALALEVRYTKEEILTIYFNRAYLGAGTRRLRGGGAALLRRQRLRGDARRGRHCSRGSSRRPPPSRPPPTSAAPATAPTSSWVS